MNKIEFRKLVAQILSQFSDEEKANASTRINEKLLELLRANQPHRAIMFYYPVTDEPQIQQTFEQILQEVSYGTRKIGPVVLPRMVKDRIVPVVISELDDLEKVENWGPKWGAIPTPKESCQIVDPGIIDIVVIPGRAFSRIGTRLGRGKGHYDRFLKDLPGAMKIGVCFHQQLFGSLPVEEHDIPMDTIVTDQVVLERAI